MLHLGTQDVSLHPGLFLNDSGTRVGRTYSPLSCLAGSLTRVRTLVMVWGQMNELNSEPAEHENGNSERETNSPMQGNATTASCVM
jgi:hypothetical protein